MADKQKDFFLTTGRRKEAIARVKFIPKGKGRILINGRDIASYFVTVDHQMQVKKPLLLADMIDSVDIKARVNGGGPSGQAGAVSLGISRALLEFNPELRSALRKENLLTRDPRAKERKKYGRKGARRRFQWTKR
ncbi:MAG: 30S ribosomal protein S9 [Candidatus Omnitrophica bacterium 4484_171]|nr:MAG: 30S ribosomal protein S9 [Candidatus Omnitrophica bacterium 4484_171]